MALLVCIRAGFAAAADVDVIMKALIYQGGPPVFNADHPFLLLIRDVKGKTILFMGRVSRP